VSVIRKSLVRSCRSLYNFWDFELSEVLWLVLFVTNLLLKCKQLGLSGLDKFMSVVDVILEALDMLLRIFKDSEKFLLNWPIILSFKKRL